MHVPFYFFDKVTFQYGIYENSRDVFPKEFHQIYDLNLLSIALEQLPVSLTFSTNPNILKTEIELWSRSREVDVKFKLTFKGIPLWDPYTENTGNRLIDRASFFDKQVHQLLVTTNDEIPSTVLLFKYAMVSKEENLENKILVAPFKFPTLSTQGIRELVKTASKENLLIKETLSYFSSHTMLLENPDYQSLFLKLMFTPGLLLQDLKKPSGYLVAQHLSNFVKKGFKHYKSIGDLETATFYLQANRLFKLYARHVDSTSDQNLKSANTFLDSQKEIKNLLAQDNLNEKVRWKLNQELTLNFNNQPSLTDEEAQELLSAIFVVNSLISIGYFDEKWSRLQIEELVHQHSATFEKLLNTGNRNQILNHLAEISSTTPLNKEWEEAPSYPYFKTTDGTYEIDLNRCTINSDRKGILPKEVAVHPDVASFFKGHPPEIVNKVGKAGFSMTFEGKKYRIFSDNKKIQIQQQFIEDGKPVWMQLIKEEETDFKSILPSFLRKTCHIFQSNKEPATLILTNSENQIVARVDSEIRQVDPKNGENTGLILDRNKNSSFLKTFSSFEHPDYFGVWVDENTALPQQIQFPRVGSAGISFQKEKIGIQERFFSSAFPGFYLAEKQYVKELQTDLSFLLLENGKGQQQVILLKQGFVENDSSRKKRKKGSRNF